ncbi:toll/interleukin-1 receptor domain-containing protein [Pseudomonas sp. R1-1]|uniref:toll/interleukin-1 receptor domain-containing protein n=1 Tax=Pseudomonas sp. R1-1 TaxID=1602529 RepID=UPI003DA99586
MATNYMYMFECDYGARVKEKTFLKDVLRTFDPDYATSVGAVINNNPYCLEFSILINIQNDPVGFELWLRESYPEKLKRHNVFLNDVIFYNVITFLEDGLIDLVFTSEPNSMFIWPERELFEAMNPQYKKMNRNESKVFISHSSKDKELIVGPLNAYLQAEDIGTWLDSYEIDYGDNIYLKVNEGIENANVGIFILTNNFFDSASGWPLAEFSTFFMDLMRSNKKVLMINAGVDQDKIHAMMKAYKYLNWDNGKGLPEIANAIRRKLGT